jgi:tRNA 2-thiouridine synthesizing protein B
MLHIVNQAPFNRSCLADCLRVCEAQAALILIEDGVYAARADGEWAQRIFAKIDKVYALDADIAARGLTGKTAANIIGVDYAEFVQLCCEYSSTHSWY